MVRVKRKIKDRPILGPSFIKKLLREDYDYGTGNVNSTDIFDITKTGMTFYNQLLPSADDETKEYMENRKGIVGHIEYMTPQEYYDDAARIHRTTAYNLKQQREYDRDIIDKLKDVITNKKKKFPITFLSFSKNYKGQEGLHRMYAAAELFGWDDVKFPVLVIEDASWTVSEKISNINVKEKNFKRSEKSLELNEVYPNKGESKKDFISRFMSVTKDEYPDRKQRYAVALSYWNRRNENLTEEKIAYLPKEHIDAINNKYKDYYKNYSIEKVAISDLLKDDPGLNDYNDLGSYHEIIWGDDVSKYRYDPKKNTNPSDVPSVVYKNGKYYINDGRHRIKALANSGYDYVELPVLREDVLTEAKEDIEKFIDKKSKDIGETVEALVQNNTVINSKIYRYSSVNTVIIPEGVTSIGNSAFYNCGNLTHITIPDSVTSIGTLAFAYCSNLTDIELPDNITSIDYGAFEHCSKLESIKLPTSLIDIGHSAFFNCRSLTNIEIPNTVTSIGQQSFWGCINLTKILIPDSVTSIEAGAFEMCINLAHVDMSNNVKSISKFIFNSCGSLTNITIPEGVTRIEEGAFFNCENLKNIKLPNSLTSIGSGAFSGCTSLTSIEIPESVTTIYPYAFRGCQNLTIYREATKKPDGWKRDWNPDKRPVIRGYKGEAKQEKLSPKKRKSRNILVYNAGDVDAGIAMFNHAAAAESLNEDENDYTNLSSSQLENLLFNDLFSEKNLMNTFKSINILPAVTDNVPKGPSFITRDGKFIDVMRTSDFIDRSKFTDRSNYSALTHYDWLKLITEALFGSKLRAYRDMLQIVTDKLGWVRCNTGESPEEDRFYCVVPDRSESRMTPKQYNSLEKYLIYGKNKNKEVLVFGGDAGNTSNSYSLRDPYYIIEKIKDYYRTGILMENVQFSNNALSRMDKYVNIIKNKNNLALLDGRDTPICYASAINNLFYFHRLGKDCILHLGTFDETGNTIVHAWVECEGKIYQTAEPKNKPKNYKLKSLKQIEISKDMSEDDIEKAIKSLYQNTGESLKESKEDIQKFVDKFGQETYNWFVKSKDRLKNNKISTDILYHAKNTSVEDMQNILHNLQSKVKSKDFTKIQGEYNYLGEFGGYKVYQPLDALASMNLGVGSGWRTTGRYRHHGDVNSKPSIEDAKEYWDRYTECGIKFYYLLDAKTMLAKYAIVLYPRGLEVNKIVSDYFIEQTNFEIYNAKDEIDYDAYFSLKDILEQLPNLNLLFKSEKIEETMEAIVEENTVIRSDKYIKAKNIVIPNNATIIGDSAFKGCTNLAEITIPNSVTSIGTLAFVDCKKLKTIELPDSVTSIGDYAFMRCYDLKSIKIPNSVTSIGTYAFATCTALTSIVLPGSITSIEDGAFEDCESLTDIEIPSEVTSIGKAAFSGCRSLTSIELPNSITSIGDNAFLLCSGLKSIKLSDSLTRIEDGVFFACSGLKTVIIPNSVSYIGYKVFAKCFNLKIYCEAKSRPEGWDLTWNSGKRPVVWGYKGKKRESLEEDVEIHNTLNSKFWEDNELKSEVREKIEAIVERFKTYLNDKNIKIDVKDILLLGSNASYNYTDDSDLDIHIIVEPKEITEDEELLKQLYDLAASAFNDKFNITLKNSDAEIYVELNDTDAHSNGIYSLEKGWIKKPIKDELKNVELDKDELNKWKKRYLSVLKEKDAKKIKKFIAELYKLRKDSIAADGEYSQGNLIFKEMRNLSYISKLKDLLDEIESEELSLEKLNEAKEDIQKFVDKFGQDIYDWFIKSKDRLKNNKISTDILYHVKNTSIEDMQNILHNLQAKTATGDLTKIQGEYKYLGEVDNYKVYQPLDALASMNLGTGSGWCTAGRYDHYGDVNFKPSLQAAKAHWNEYTSQGIKFYYLLDSKTMLAEYAIVVYPKILDVNKAVSDYYIEQTNFEIYNAEDKIDYSAYISLRTVIEQIPNLNLLFKGEKLEETETMEAIVEKNRVIRSPKYLKAKNIIIPDNATSIDDYAFGECENLTSIKIPNSVTNIGDAAFYSCSNLMDIEIPNSVRYIGYNAFENCVSLTSVTIPKGVTNIESGTFSGCSNLTSIKIPDGVNLIGISAFFNCNNLTSIELPDSLTSIGSSAFSYCSSLTSIEIPDNTVRIDSSAFHRCNSLISAIIPDSVTNMGFLVFAGCSNLTIYCEAESKPDNWNIDWNPNDQPVVWGYKGK